MIIHIEEQEKKELIQQTVDRLLYCKGFKKELKYLLAHYDPKKDTKVSNNPSEFKFPLSESF